MEESGLPSVPVCSYLPDGLSSKLFNLLDPVYSEHQNLLATLEARLTSWNDKRNKKTSDESTASIPPNGELPESTEIVYRVGDLFVENLRMLPLYQNYLTEVENLILSIEEAVRSNPVLDEAMRNFEAQKVCYLPFYVFLLKPMHRLLQYRVTLERLMRHYGEAHPDAPDCRIAHARLLDLIQSQWESYKRVENIYKLLEIQRDLVGLSSFPQNSDSTGTTPNGDCSTSSSPWGPLLRLGRQFIREGWLQKLSKKGYQPRIFFLFSDQLVYASRMATAYLQFKVHGQFQLHDLMVEEAEPAHSFTVFSGNRCFLVAAPSDWQRDRWLEDISRAILAAKTKPSPGMETGVSISMVDSKLSIMDSNEAADSSTILQRVTTTSVHVCWHRSFTYSMQDILRANEYQTSGYLLRKFKNSNGWQRLWVVFTQNCLFFYKSYRDDCPLASLPLLGYIITTPGADDQIRRDNVIKMQFKNHVYFFRGETHHSFEKYVILFSVLSRHQCPPSSRT
ncbi:unnamed protein product [Echinostoma caproni]|uniref:PH domain-containing protein n=1 Tax=Echinostoma caproni TaxID=27848 RepID=A0A183AHE7_9TREM|nr:unnamed protein product [Echinostoma caproni]